MNRFLLIILVLSLGGCAKLAHLQELLTLKDMSDNADRQDKYVKAQDAKFDKLLAAVEADKIKEYNSKKEIKRDFGDPVFCRPDPSKDQSQEECLYRYAKQYFDSPKVYFYFDSKGVLKSWQHFAAPDKASLPKADEQAAKACCR